MIFDTFSVDQKNELYMIIGRILSGEAAKLIINEAIKDMSGVKVSVLYEGGR